MLLAGLAEALRRGGGNEAEFRAVVCDEVRLADWVEAHWMVVASRWEVAAWVVRAGGVRLAWPQLVNMVASPPAVGGNTAAWVLAAEILQQLDEPAGHEKWVSGLIARAWGAIRSEEFISERLTLKAALLRTLRFALQISPSAARKTFFLPKGIDTDIFTILWKLSLECTSEIANSELQSALSDEFADLIGSLWLATNVVKPGRKVDVEQEEISWGALWRRTSCRILELFASVFPVKLDDFSARDAVTMGEETILAFRVLRRLLEDGTRCHVGMVASAHLGRVASVEGAVQLIEETSRVANLSEEFLQEIARANAQPGTIMRSAMRVKNAAGDFLSAIDSSFHELFLPFPIHKREDSYGKYARRPVEKTPVLAGTLWPEKNLPGTLPAPKPMQETAVSHGTPREEHPSSGIFVAGDIDVPVRLVASSQAIETQAVASDTPVSREVERDESMGESDTHNSLDRAADDDSSPPAKRQRESKSRRLPDITSRLASGMPSTEALLSGIVSDSSSED